MSSLRGCRMPHYFARQMNRIACCLGVSMAQRGLNLGEFGLTDIEASRTGHNRDSENAYVLMCGEVRYPWRMWQGHLTGAGK